MKDIFGKYETTKTFIQFLANCRYEDLPPEVIEKTKVCIIDALGSAIAGPATMEPVRIANSYAKRQGSGDVTLIGDGTRVPLQVGALCNAISSMALDLGDVHRSSFFHAGAAIIPPAISYAEHLGKTGKDIILAVALGIETGVRVALAVNPELRMRGLDTTSNCGIFGAAAACASLHGGDEEFWLNALSLAGTQAGGDIQYIIDGDWSKCIHPGKASSDGVLAVELAALGYKGSVGIFEGRFGFPNTSGGGFHPEKLIEGLGSNWKVLEMGLKVHAACRFSNTPVDIALALTKKKPGVKVTKAKLYMSSMGVDQLGNRNVRSFYDAQMSAPFLVAVALLKSRVNYRDLLDSLGDENVVKEMDLVDFIVDEKLPSTSRAARLELIFEDGTSSCESRELPQGEPECPHAPGLLEEKFLALASEYYKTESERQAILYRLSHIEELKDARVIWELDI